MSVQWTETASSQLQAARDYLAQSSPGYAQALASRIITRADALENQPYLGSEVLEYGAPSIRELYVHPYRIIYQVVGNDIRILSVIHFARQMPRTPPIS